MGYGGQVAYGTIDHLFGKQAFPVATVVGRPK